MRSRFQPGMHPTLSEKWTWSHSCLLLVLLLPLLVVQVAPSRADDWMEHWFTFDPPMLKEYQDVEVAGDLAFIFALGGLAIYDLVGLTDGHIARLSGVHGKKAWDEEYFRRRAPDLVFIQNDRPLDGFARGRFHTRRERKRLGLRLIRADRRPQTGIKPV